jgi:hypothetical protein
MLDAQVVVNLSPKLSISADFARNGDWLWSKIHVWLRNGSHQGLGGTGGKPWCREGAPRPGKVTPKDSTHLPVVRATPGQLDHFAALALQQLGQQPALREGRGVFCHNVVFHVRGTNFHRFPGLYLWGLGPNGERNFYSRYHVV